MKVSGRNQLHGKVKNLQREGLLSQVTLDIGGQEMTAVITSGAIDDLGIKVGDDVDALVKATSVMIMK